jgi:flagellar motor switch protein FliM
MSLCIPYNVIEPVIEKLSSQSWGAYKRSRGDDLLRKRVAGQLDAAKVTVTAILADTTIRLGDLIKLQRGDVIVTEKPASAALALTIEGRRKYIGTIGQHRGNRAFQVLRPMSPKDRV